MTTDTPDRSPPASPPADVPTLHHAVPGLAVGTPARPPGAPPVAAPDLGLGTRSATTMPSWAMALAEYRPGADRAAPVSSRRKRKASVPASDLPESQGSAEPSPVSLTPSGDGPGSAPPRRRSQAPVASTLPPLDGQAAAQQALAQALNQAAGPRRLRSVAVLGWQARAFKHERFASAATSVANALARDLACERVSIGFLHKGRMVVAAMSNTADIQHRQKQVRAIAQAMDEAVDQCDCVVHPLPPGIPTLVTQAHADLAALNGQLAVCSVPIVGAGGPRSGAEPIGALLLERPEAFDAEALQAAKDAATFVGPILALKQRLDQPVSGRIVEAVSPAHTGLMRPGHRAALAGGVGLLLLAIGLWPGTFRVVAPARAEGQGQHILAAPFDGFVRSAALRPGALVKKDQVLLQLEDRDLLTEQRKWATELAQLDKKYREAHSTDDAAQIVLAKSKLEQAQAQLDQINQQLERAQLRAPFNGVLLAGDLTQATGAPVKRGQELLTLAPDRTYRIVAEVDEQDVAVLRERQTARVLFGALDGQALPLQVTRIAPLATVIDGRNVFEVDGLLDGPAPEGLRPGLRGVVRIDVAERPLGWMAWHRCTQWARRTWWRLLG